MTAEPNRTELDPVPMPEAGSVGGPNGAGTSGGAAGSSGRSAGEAPGTKRAESPEITAALDRLIGEMGGKAGSFESRLVRDLLVTGLKLLPDARHTGELKLITAAVKELRYAFNVFSKYAEPHKVSIFGSARTPTDHPDYASAVRFGKIMADMGWMVITGAGDGIMKAGHEGPGRKASFGVAIRLPFETTANEVIAGDEKLIHFRYFFTRKLMFMSQAEAVALFPGGFGTMDEAFEALTLIQTGKASMIPIVLCEGTGGSYWREWDLFIRKGLFERRFISADDVALYKICDTPDEAAEHIQRFYRVYHSSRYVRDELVLRLKKPLDEAQLDTLNTDFARLVKEGRMAMRGPLEGEEDHRDLPRLVFTHTRRDFGLVRRLIDRINSF